MPGGLRLAGGDGDLLAQVSVHQGRLADIGPADDGDETGAVVGVSGFEGFVGHAGLPELSNVFSWVATTVMLIPPRALKAPVTSIQCGSRAATRSSQMVLTTCSWNTP